LKDVVIFNDINPENLGIGQQIFTALAEMLRSVSWSSMVSWPGSIAASKSVCRRLGRGASAFRNKSVFLKEIH